VGLDPILHNLFLLHSIQGHEAEADAKQCLEQNHYQIPIATKKVGQTVKDEKKLPCTWYSFVYGWLVYKVNRCGEPARPFGLKSSQAIGNYTGNYGLRNTNPNKRPLVSVQAIEKGILVTNINKIIIQFSYLSLEVYLASHSS